MTTFTPVLHNSKENELKQGQTTSTFPFLQYSFGQRLKTSNLPPPFSKLFFTSNTKFNMLEQPVNDTFRIIHDQELCMFSIKLDAKGTTGK